METSRRGRRDPNLCSFCGTERPGELRVISKKRRIQICVDCAQRCHEIAAQGKDRKSPEFLAQAAQRQAEEPETQGRHRLLQHLALHRFIVISALPRNDARLAAAAASAGAMALQVHLNLDEESAGSHFGGFRDEGTVVAGIMEIAGPLPVGVVPGERRMVTTDELLTLDAMGLDYFGVAAQWMPAWMLAENGRQMSAMMSLPPGTTPEHAEDLLGSPAPGRQIDLVEAATIPPERYGQPLTAWDLATYGRLAQAAAPKPLFVRAECAVRPGELSLLAEAGVRGLIAGHHVMPGKDADAVARATEAYAAVAREL